MELWVGKGHSSLLTYVLLHQQFDPVRIWTEVEALVSKCRLRAESSAEQQVFQETRVEGLRSDAARSRATLVAGDVTATLSSQTRASSFPTVGAATLDTTMGGSMEGCKANHLKHAGQLIVVLLTLSLNCCSDGPGEISSCAMVAL